MRIKFSDYYNKWFDDLKDEKLRSIIQKRFKRIDNNNMGDFKSLGGGLFEIKINYGAGYRIYFKFENDKVIIILVGGNKSSQDKDIKKARSLL
jgi:putative addiction module killer protein